MSQAKIILPGGNGFAGRILARAFAQEGWDVVVLTRAPENARGPGRRVAWDGLNLGEWARELDGAQAVVNLAGRSVNCRYHARNRQQMMDSRVLSTKVLGQAIARCAAPPPVWINVSTATIYKHSLDRAWDEEGEIGATKEAKDEFSIEVARAWEEAFDAAVAPATRKIKLRLAMIFGLEPGSVFRVLRRLVRMGLGGRMASGRQYVSWIHEEDFSRAVRWLVETPGMKGVVNCCAPNPLTNAEMMRALRHELHRPIGLPAERWMLEIGALFLRTETELIIKSRRVVPARMLETGFQFNYTQMPEAIHELEMRLGAQEKGTL